MFKTLGSMFALGVAADLPVIEVGLAGGANLAQFDAARDAMESRFISQLKEKVSMIQKSSSPTVSKAISNVLDVHTALFQTQKDHAVAHAALMQAPTSLRVRVSDSANAALINLVAKHEAALNAREVELFNAALISLDTGVAPSSMLLESKSAGDQEFAVKVASGSSMSFVDSVKLMSQRRGDKLREIRDVMSGVVAQLAQQ